MKKEAAARRSSLSIIFIVHRSYNDAEFIRLISTHKVFAVVRAESAELALRAAEAAIMGGIKLLEVALVMPGGFRVISDLRHRYGDRACIGAGSVLSYDQIDRAIKSGPSSCRCPTRDCL